MTVDTVPHTLPPRMVMTGTQHQSKATGKFTFQIKSYYCRLMEKCSILLLFPNKFSIVCSKFKNGLMKPELESLILLWLNDQHPLFDTVSVLQLSEAAPGQGS